jgi:peptidyl-prolyl cis-trans isomerase D
MSIITRIRNNGWIIIVALTLGMLGFLLQDAFNSKTGLFGGAAGVGVIDGREITSKEFYEKEKQLFEGRQGESYGQRSQLWDYLIQTTLAENLATRMGLSVGTKELENLMTDPVSLSPAVQRRFMNQQNGQVDQQGLQQFVQLYKSKAERAKLRPEGIEFIKSLEQEAVTSALMQKVMGMVQKSIYTPKWMADMEQVKTQPFDFKFVPVPFAAVPDADAKVTDADLKAYIADHTKLYTRTEETRNVDFALMTVNPSPADSAAIRTEISTLADGLRAAQGEKGDSAFCANNYGNFNGMFFSKKDIPGSLGDTAFKFPIATVVGPYPEQGFFRVVKIVARQMVTDSVKSRHILIGVKQGDNDATAKARVDSFKTAIASGSVSFDSLARKFGTDATKEKGGDLGFTGYGGMVKEFNDLIFFAAVPGQLYTVKTQFGWHLVEVMEKKGGSERVKLAFLNKAIVPSKETENEAFNKAQTFAQKNRTTADLEKNAKITPGFRFGSAKDLKINDFTAQDLDPSEASRNIVKWAHNDNTNVGEVSPDVYSYNDQVNAYVNKYVIAGLKRVTPKGVASVDDVRDEVTTKARNLKKAEIIKNKIGKTTDMAAIATMFKSEIKEAGQVTMGSPVVPGLGAEPKVIAAAIATDLNKVSKPVVGENGVFVVMPATKPVATPVTDYTQLRRQLDGQMKQQAGGAFFQALRKNAKIEDNSNSYF